MSEPVEVRVREGDCPCPGTPHTEEIVYLVPHITIPMGIAAYAAIRAGTNSQDVQAALGAVWLRHGISAWTFTTEENRPLPITPENVEEVIPWQNGGFEVANAADDLYAGDLFRPLVKRPTASSSSTRTGSSTRPTTPSGRTPRKSSRRSLPNGQDGKPSVARAL